jgi:hypothetical protein
MRRRPDRDDGGTILLLTLGYAAVALLLVCVVVDSSVLFLARRSLAAACDGASLSAAQAVDQPGLYAEGGGVLRLPLAQVQAAVDRYETENYGDGTALDARIRGADTVICRASRIVALPFVTSIGLGPIRVAAEAEAVNLRAQPVVDPGPAPAGPPGPGGGGGPTGSDRLTANARRLQELIIQRFGVTHILGWRPYDRYPDHPSGRALDIMLLPIGSASTALGNEIAAWLTGNADALGVSYVIWRQQVWSVERPYWRPMEDRGSPTANHYDHVHVTVEG